MARRSFLKVVGFGVLLLTRCICMTGAERARAGVANLGTLADGLGRIYVVQAKVAAVKDEPAMSNEFGRVATATLAVTRVYCGDGIKVGDNFPALTMEGGPPIRTMTRGIRIPSPVPKVGDVGIWRVFRSHDDRAFRGNSELNDFACSNRWILRFAAPFLGGEGEQSKEEVMGAKDVAESLLALTKAANEAERLQLLVNQVRTGSRYVAATDCWLLANATAVENRQVVVRRLFLDKEVAIPVRVALDAYLCEWREDGWLSSKQRIDTFAEMATLAREREEFLIIGERLDIGIYYRELTMVECLRIARAALLNETVVPECGDQVYRIAKFTVARNNDERDAVFESFIGLLLPDAQPEVTYAAAWGLASVGTNGVLLTDQQLGKIRKLRDTLKDEGTRRLLEDIPVATAEKRLAIPKASERPSRPADDMGG